MTEIIYIYIPWSNHLILSQIRTRDYQIIQSIKIVLLVNINAIIIQWKVSRGRLSNTIMDSNQCRINRGQHEIKLHCFYLNHYVLEPYNDHHNFDRIGFQNFFIYYSSFLTKTFNPKKFFFVVNFHFPQ